MVNMKELYEKVAKDCELQAKFYVIIGNAEKIGEQKTGEELISFAKDAGFDITLDEMKDFFKEKSESAQAALSDAELDMVAGGKSMLGENMAAVSGFTLGVGCAFVSIHFEVQGSGYCGQAFK